MTPTGGSPPPTTGSTGAPRPSTPRSAVDRSPRCRPSTRSGTSPPPPSTRDTASPPGWQTPTPAPQANGGRMVTDTGYDARGLTVKASVFWNTTSGPTDTLVGFADTDVANQQRSSYDNLERPTVDALWSRNTLKWQTATGYDGA